MTNSTAHDQHRVSLVIPGRNCSATIRRCLEHVMAICDQPNSPLGEVIFVDDNSSDDTAAIVAEFDRVQLLQGPGRGPGAARNIGWRAARFPLIWFIDSDCIAEPEALNRLLPHLDEPDVGGVGGSYGIENDHSMLARLIHEEIIERHRRMSSEVDVLASFNVLYPKAVLEDVGGFDERYIVAEDAHLSIAVRNTGRSLRFEPDSRVGHYHPQQLRGYLRTQARHGFWRTILHLEHTGQEAGNSYSGLLDHLQPVLAMATLASLIVPITALILPSYVPLWVASLPIVLLVLTALTTVPMTLRLLRQTGRASMLLFLPMCTIRAMWRGIGMTSGVVQYVLLRRHRKSELPQTTRS